MFGVKGNMFMTFLPFCVTAGVWATKLGEMAGVKVPLIAMHHAYVVTERIEGIQVRPPFLESMLYLFQLMSEIASRGFTSL